MLSILRRLQPTRIIQLIIKDKTIKTVAYQIQTPLQITFCAQHNLNFIRYKSKGNKRKADESTETETEDDKWDDQVTDKHSKIMNVSVGSLRVDGLLKAGLGLARNKIDVLFYDSKIRVNGQKIMKKSVPAKINDEIDIIKGGNKDLLTVARVEILDIKDKGDTFNVKLRRCKSLLIDNYEDKSGTSDK